MPRLYRQKLLIHTHSGKRIDVDTPQMEQIDIRDIAHALANICRYNGHCRYHYSVAQHSIYVSLLVPQKEKLWALLHDAAEAYLGDVIAPLKVRTDHLGYRELERQWEVVIFRRFGLLGLRSPYLGHTPAIGEADDAVSLTETEQLSSWQLEHMGAKGVPAPIRITRMCPHEAERWFLEVYNALHED